MGADSRASPLHSWEQLSSSRELKAQPLITLVRDILPFKAVFIEHVSQRPKTVSYLSMLNSFFFFPVHPTKKINIQRS